MSDINKFTTKEVLNKVLLDSSGNAVNAFSHTTQEAFNAALDDDNSRLNVNLVGGTIGGDVTITGDLTVNGDSVANISEIVQGDMKITSSASGHPILTLEQTGDHAAAGQLIFLTSGAANDNDDSGVIRFKGMNDAGTPEEIEYATIYSNHTDVSDGSEDGELHFRTMSAGSLDSRLTLSSSNATFAGKVAISSAFTNNELLGVKGSVSADWGARIENTHSTGAGALIKSATTNAGVQLFQVRSGSENAFTITGDKKATFGETVLIDGVSNYTGLEIKGAGGARPSIKLSNVNNGAIGSIYGTEGNALIFSSGTGGATSLTLDSSQNATFGGAVNIASGLTTTGAVLNLQTNEPSIAANDVLGRINFQAPLEADGADGDARLVGASIHALVTASDFNDTKNTTDLVFSTAVSETASEKMRITSDGKVGIGISSINGVFTAYGTPMTAISAQTVADIFGDVQQDADKGGGIGLGGRYITDSSSVTAFAEISGVKANNTSSNYEGEMVFKTRVNGGNLIERMRLDTNSRISLSNNDSGTSNTVFGKLAGDDLASGGNYNSLFGESAGHAITTGDDNVAVGYQSMLNATTGTDTVAIGKLAIGSGVLTGANNIAIGEGAGFDLTAGSYNILLGLRAGANITTANKNIFIGQDAGLAVTTTGGSNVSDGTVGIGHDTLKALTSGTSNTAVGFQAGNILTTGGTNTIIGNDADVDANSRSGCIVIGSGLSLNTASDNVVEIGNDTNSMTYDLDGGDITVTSDVRTKKNIKDTKLGLEFINKLRPITYQTKPSSQYPKEFGIKNPSKKSSGKTWDGLIAQEVKEVMDEMNVEFSGWGEGINTKQKLAYGKFVMPLIKAVQELTARVKELESK